MTGWTVPCTLVDTQGTAYEKTAVVVLEDVSENEWILDLRFEGTSRNVVLKLADVEQVYSAISGRVWEAEREAKAAKADD